jgi:hypothetical protein
VSPIVHAELAWLVAQPLARRRDRLLVAAAGVLPDLDAASALAGLESYGRWHHVLGHNLFVGVALAALCAALARARGEAALLALAAFHVHLLADLAGSGREWTVSYLWPASALEVGWSHGWALDAWPNQLIGLAVTLACLALALPLRRTPVELFSARADREVVRTIWRRFGRAGDPFTAPRSGAD